MEKPATNQYPIHPLIKKRWSTLAFDNRPVETEKLQSLLEATRWSASCYNEQPWYFILETKDNEEGYNRLFSCIVPANQTWVKNAPVLMLGIAKTTFTHNDKPNRHGVYDLGASIAFLSLQAVELGLVIHQMGGFDPDLARELYHIPDGYEIITAVAIGYQGNVEQLPEDLQKRELSPRQRKELSSFVFSGTWRDTSPIVL